MPTEIPSAPPFTRLADPTGDYSLSIWLQLFFDHHPHGITPGKIIVDETNGAYIVSAGRRDGLWRLKTSPVVGSGPITGLESLGSAVTDLRGQDTGPDPFALVQAPLTGRLSAEALCALADRYVISPKETPR